MSGHRRITPIHIGDGLEDFVLRRTFEQIAARPGNERLENLVAIFIRREHQDQHIRNERLEFPHAFDAVHLGKIDVHEKHVRNVLQDFAQRLFPAAITTRAGKALPLADLGREVVAYPVVIFDE